MECSQQIPGVKVINGRKMPTYIKLRNFKTPHLVQTNISQRHNLVTHPRVHVSCSDQLNSDKSAVSYLNVMKRIVCQQLRKLPDLQEAIIEHMHHIIGVTDTWLDTEINDAEVNIADTSLFRCHCSGYRIGGGVAHITMKD